ncbi:MAG: epoxyqueuosine reductase [Lentisphaeria bacterium]|nr:epoxyqueuosine reductase [Lentisphaeria bacterium]
MLTAEMVKAHALESGADIVGIASMDRFSELPAQYNPQSIFPEAKSMVVLGFRLFRGIFRGIQEGTFFTAYNLMGYAGTKWVFQPIALWKFVKLVENAGFECVPIPDNFPWSNIDEANADEMGQGFIDVNAPAYKNDAHGTWSRPAAPDRPAPDVFFQLRLAAYCAGLGEVGYSGMFLTPEFGPRQMFAAVITDAELEPDPLFEGELCDNCMDCVRECPGQAISDRETTRIKIAGRELEWAKLDFDKCAVAFHGGGENADNPFNVSEKDEEGFNQQPYPKSKSYKLGPILWSGRGLGGMRGCQMACMAHLEEQGKLKNTFKRPFRLDAQDGSDS